MTISDQNISTTYEKNEKLVTPATNSQNLY